MRSPLKLTALVPERSVGSPGTCRLSPRRDPRRKGRNLPSALPRLPARRRDPVPRESERVTDRYDDLPNNFTFGIYVHGELYSSIRISVLTRRMARLAVVGNVRRHASSRAGPRQDHHRSDALRGRSRQGTSSSPNCLTSRCGSAMSPAAISTPISGLPMSAPSIGPSTARCSCRNPGASRGLYPGLIKPVGLMAANYPEIRERVFQRFPVSCARARSSGGCCSSAPASAVSTPHDVCTALERASIVPSR